MSRIITTFVAVVLLFGPAPFSFAQTQNEDSEVLSVITTGGSDPTSPLQCFDHYDFNSVEISLESSVADTVPGTPMVFTGTIENTNPYPLTDVTLIAKVFRVNEETVQQSNGNELVDYFVVEENVLLKDGEKRALQVDWKVPENANGGNYFVAVYVLDNDFAVTGLAFSDDVYTNAIYFSVSAEDSDSVFLNKNATTLNTEKYKFVALPPTVSAPGVITTTLVNPSDEVRTVPLQWKQYSFDESKEDNLRNVKTEAVTLQPGETKSISYEAKEDRAPVVFVTATTEDNGGRSILHMRYIQAGKADMARFSFVGLPSFPLVAGTDITPFACAHSTGETLSDHKITLTLTDNNTGETIHMNTYEGTVSGLVGGYGEMFNLTSSHDNVTLRAVLEHQGVVTEDVSIKYNCQDMDPSSCLPEETTTNSFKLLFFGAAFALLLALLLILFLHRRRTSNNINAMTAKPPTALFFLLLLPTLILTSFLVSPSVVEAKTVAATGVHSGGLVGSIDGITVNFQADYTVLYHATLVNQATGQLVSDGSTLSAGTVVELRPGIRANAGVVTSDVHYNFTGNVWGTPNGAWDGFYDPGDLIGNGFGLGCLPNLLDHYYQIRTSFAVNKVPETFTLSGIQYTELSPGVYRLDGNGSAIASVTFPNTIGRWYVYNHAQSGQNECGGSHGITTANINSRSINFNINVTGANNPPATPTITGPAIGNTGIAYDFTVSGGTDPDGDQIRYGITDSACTNVTQWLPNLGYFNPGSQNYNRSWGTEGPQTIYVLAEDSNGGRSSCVSHTINITNAPAPTVDLKINASDGPLAVGKNDTLNLSWTSSNATRCSLFGAGLPGGFVALNGNTSVPASAITSSPESYTLSCVGSGSTLDFVEVSVGNQPPNAPAITGPASADGGVSNNFTFTATDPDNDQIFYEIDWDNNGTVDVSTPGSSYVNSGTTLSGNRSWSAVGSYTFQVRTVDFDNARSSWSSHTITINNSVPATANLEVSVNGGSWSSSDQTVNSTDSVSLRWSSTNASSCSGSGSGFNTSNNTSGSDNVDTPSSNSSINFQVNCTGPGGNGSDSLTVTTRQLPNLTTSQNASPQYGTFDPVTGTYSQVTVFFRTQNSGGSDTTRAADYRFELDLNNDGSYETNVTRNDGIGNIAVAGGENDNETVSGPIPFGTHGVRITADSSSPDKVDETEEGDNVYTGTITTAPADPGLSITANPGRLQSGQNTIIDWSASNPYAMSCSIFGPGIATRNFNLLSATAADRNLSAGPITAKSEYTLRCTTAGTNFTDTVTVETQGVIEEI